MSIQGSINQAIGTAAVAKKMFTQQTPTSGVAAHMDEAYSAQPHDVMKMQEANAKAQTNASTQKQQKSEAYYKKLLQGYSTSLGPLKDLDPKIQKAMVEQDPTLRKYIKESMEIK